MVTVTTKEGVSLRVFSSCYVDWGLEIIGPDGKELYYSPCALSNESYGSTPPQDENGEYDELADEWIPWTEQEWADCIGSEADELIDALCYEGWTGRNGSYHELFGWECIEGGR